MARPLACTPLWDDSRIRPGSDWRQEISSAIDRAKVAILLVSADFLASDFVHRNELPPLLENAKRLGTIILPLVISPCRFSETDNLSHFQSVNDPSKPLSLLTKPQRERTFLKLSNDIEQILTGDTVNAPISSNDTNQSTTKDGTALLVADGYPTPSRHTHVKLLFESILEKAEALAGESPAPLTGITTGFRDLDRITSGLRPAELAVFAAEPSMGLTSFAASIALYASEQNDASILFYTMGMPRETLSTRMLCSDSIVDAYRFNQGFLCRDDWGRLANSLGKLSDKKLFVNDQYPLTTADIASGISEISLADKVGTNLVIVDNIELLQDYPNTDSDHRRVSMVARQLKNIARDSNVPIIALLQIPPLSPARLDHRPTLVDLRKTGSFEQIADLIAFLYVPEKYAPTEENQGLAELHVVRNRYGSIGNIDLAFMKSVFRFANIYKE